jgi:hypothetical protein
VRLHPVHVGQIELAIEHPSRTGILEAFRVDGDHDAVVANAERFVPTLLRAVHSVVERSAATTP